MNDNYSTAKTYYLGSNPIWVVVACASIAAIPTWGILALMLRYGYATELMLALLVTIAGIACFAWLLINGTKLTITSSGFRYKLGNTLVSSNWDNVQHAEFAPVSPVSASMGLHLTFYEPPKVALATNRFFSSPRAWIIPLYNLSMPKGLELQHDLMHLAPRLFPNALATN